jgi:hypothetical protein
MKHEFSKNTQTSNFMKVPPMEAEFFYADRRTDMTKLTVTFSNFSKAPKYYNGTNYNDSEQSSTKQVF